MNTKKLEELEDRMNKRRKMLNDFQMPDGLAGSVLMATHNAEARCIDDILELIGIIKEDESKEEPTK